MTKFKEYIKIDGADSIIGGIAKTSAEFDDAINKTHLIAEHKKDKYQENRGHGLCSQWTRRSQGC